MVKNTSKRNIYWNSINMTLMSDAQYEQFPVIIQGTEAWNNRRQENPDTKIDLSQLYIFCVEENDYGAGRIRLFLPGIVGQIFMTPIFE